MNVFTKWLVATMLLCLTSVSLLAQGTQAIITGTVIDERGEECWEPLYK